VQIKTAKALFAAKYIDIEAASGIPDARYEPFQIEYLNTDARFAIYVKARQIAWSFTAALDAVVDGILNPNTPHIFTSINMDEAAEKIRYGRAIVEAIRPDRRPRLVGDSASRLEFDNGSRLISHPCRPPRGKPQARIYLDEIAHYPSGMATTKGDGYIRIGSSPLGATGLFWEIATEATRKYPGYNGHRHFLPWWEVRALCRNPLEAHLQAEGLLTEERVRTYGTQSLVEIYENMLLEDFQQEYECAWVDETTSWIPWDIVTANQAPDLVHFRAKGVDEALGLIPDVLRAVAAGTIEPALTGGVDIGRTRDLTELIAVGKTTTGQFPVRVMVSLDRVEYDSQERCLRELITRLPFTQVLVDQNGIGAQLAENLSRTGRAQGVAFTNATKELWAVEARIQAERKATPLPVDRELAYQIHSIRKSVTAAKNNVFDTERNEKHHADKFWAWALAIWAASQPRGVFFA
jgi:hypothetical protein